jgi:hypothetical protein
MGAGGFGIGPIIINNNLPAPSEGRHGGGPPPPPQPKVREYDIEEVEIDGGGGGGSSSVEERGGEEGTITEEGELPSPEGVPAQKEEGLSKSAVETKQQPIVPPIPAGPNTLLPQIVMPKEGQMQNNKKEKEHSSEENNKKSWLRPGPGSEGGRPFGGGVGGIGAQGFIGGGSRPFENSANAGGGGMYPPRHQIPFGVQDGFPQFFGRFPTMFQGGATTMDNNNNNKMMMMGKWPPQQQSLIAPGQQQLGAAFGGGGNL